MIEENHHKQKSKKGKDKEPEYFTNDHTSQRSPDSIVRDYVSSVGASLIKHFWVSLPRIKGESKDAQSRALHYT